MLLATQANLPSVNQLFIQAVLGVSVIQLLIQIVLFALLAFIVFRRKPRVAVLCSAIMTAVIGICWTFLDRSASARYYSAQFVSKQVIDQIFIAMMAANILVPALFSGLLVFLIPFFQGKKGRVG